MKEFNYKEFTSELSKKQQEYFKQYEAIFKLLYNWQEDWHLYDILTFHDTQFYKLEEEDSFLKYWDVDLRSHFEDKFITFSYDGAGGNFCFWLYPGLVGEPPIVFLDGHGEQEFLASNLNDFVNRMINELNFCGGWICKDDDVEKTFKEMRWELVDSYEEKNKGKKITEDEVEVEVLFKKDRALFKEKARKIISFKTTEQIKKDFDKHPNFDKWIDKVQLKNDELVKKTPFKKEEYKLILKMYDNMLKLPKYTKESFVKDIKENQPIFYKSNDFQNWMK